ncbi:MAG: AAA family ATPase [Bacillota bacterium]
MRLKRVILENFQSHRQTEIVLAPTVTVLIGESDQGKSAVVRALRWLFYNKPKGADFLRVGADRCRVAVEFEDGLTIVRERRGKTNRYEILQPGREPYVEEGFGRDVPEAVQELTEIRPLKLEGASFELHVAHQLDPPFLLKETPAVRARAVGHLSGTHLFDAADKRAARKLAELTRQRRELEDEVARIQVQMEGFSDLPRLEAQYEECAAFFERGRETGIRVEMLSALKEGFKSVLRELRESENLLESLPRPEDLQARGEQVSALILLFHKLSGLNGLKKGVHSSLERVKNVLAETATVKEAEMIAREAEAVVERVRVLQEMGSRRASLLSDMAKIEGILKAVETLPQAEELHGRFRESAARLAVLQEMFSRLTETSRRLLRVEGAEAELKDVWLAARCWDELQGNTERLRRLKELRQQLLSVRRELAAAEKRLTEARAEAGRQAGKLRELLLKTNRCPVCFTPLSPEQVERILKKELEEESR